MSLSEKRGANNQNQESFRPSGAAIKNSSFFTLNSLFLNQIFIFIN